MDPALRLQPGQQELTPAQEAEAECFAEEYIRRQLSTEPVDEQEAEAWLRQAYQVAQLPPPQRILWVDGPLQLVAVLAPQNVKASIWASGEASVWHSVGVSAAASVWHSIGDSVRCSVRNRIETSVMYRVKASVWNRVYASVWNRVYASVWNRVYASVGDSVTASVGAYYYADKLAFYHFFAAYLAPNDLQALAHFNEQVSGYWLGQDMAIIVRRPKVLSRDEQGRLHNATGLCIAYHDGWGLYAWHGVCVPARVILDPDSLTCVDFQCAPDVEVRRVMQERMGSRFVSELGGVVIDSGPRGTLYEVRLPEDDPERMARYVQVQDASTERRYLLRVPPTIQTAAEAVAWSFRLSVEAYGPAHET